MSMRSNFLAVLAASVLLLGADGGAVASTVDLTGSRFGHDGLGTFAGYGASTSKHNVVSYGPSKVSDPTHGAAWLLESAGHQGAAFATVPNYAVDWYFIGAESGHDIELLQLGFTEHNQNNSAGGPTVGALWFLGTTAGAGSGNPILLSLLDLNGGTGLLNGANNTPGAYIASLMYAYVEPLYKKGLLTGWRLTRKATDWFIFALDDAGSKDNDHDDFVGIAHVRQVSPPNPQITPTPLPGALPLMATVFGAGFVLSRWRKRSAAKLRT